MPLIHNNDISIDPISHHFFQSCSDTRDFLCAPADLTVDRANWKVEAQPEQSFQQPLQCHGRTRAIPTGRKTVRPDERI